jgi:hypothetical protein
MALYFAQIESLIPSLGLKSSRGPMEGNYWNFGGSPFGMLVLVKDSCICRSLSPGRHRRSSQLCLQRV